MNDDQARELYNFIRVELLKSGLSEIDTLVGEFVNREQLNSAHNFVLAYIEKLSETLDAHDARVTDSIIDSLNDNVQLHNGQKISQIVVEVRNGLNVEALNLRAMSNFRSLVNELKVTASIIRDDHDLDNRPKIKI